MLVVALIARMRLSVVVVAVVVVAPVWRLRLLSWSFCCFAALVASLFVAFAAAAAVVAAAVIVAVAWSEV